MSYSRSLEEARAAINKVELDNESSMASSPILNGQESGGPAGRGELAPKTYTLGKHSTEFKREL